MTNHAADTSQRKAVKIAGWAYLLIIVTTILAMIFGSSKLIVKGDAAASFNNITANETLFRIDTAYSLIMFASVIILALALYVTLKPVNKHLAMLALLWRFAEAIIGCLMVLSSLIALLLLNSQDYAAVFETEQLQALVGLFLDVSPAVVPILFVFISLGTIVNCYLFYKSQYIPRILAALGIFAWSVVLIAAFATIVIPSYAATIDMVAKALGTLWEIAIGLWLIIKGINVEQSNSPALESA